MSAGGISRARGPGIEMAMFGTGLYDEFYIQTDSVPLNIYILPDQAFNEYQCFDARVQKEPADSSITLWLAVKHTPKKLPLLAFITPLTVELFAGAPGNESALGKSIQDFLVHKCKEDRPRTFVEILKFRFSKEDERYKDLLNMLDSPNFDKIPFAVTVQATS